MSTQAFICDAIRTPFGRYGGSLSSVRADDLAAIPIRALMARNPGVDWEAVGDVLLGCANQAGEDNRNVARMASLLAGLPLGVPGATINRLCGSGLDAVGSAARAIKSGETALMVAGGVESMSRAPFVMPKAESAFSRANAVYDTTIGWRFVNKLMKEQYGADAMPETAENVAVDYKIGRDAQDRMALASQPQVDCTRSARLGPRQSRGSRRGTPGGDAQVGARNRRPRRIRTRIDQGRIQRAPRRCVRPVTHGARSAAARIPRLRRARGTGRCIRRPQGAGCNAIRPLTRTTPGAPDHVASPYLA